MLGPQESFQLLKAALICLVLAVLLIGGILGGIVAHFCE